MKRTSFGSSEVSNPARSPGLSSTGPEVTLNPTPNSFATMFARLAEYEYKNDGSYTDVDGHWAEEYIYEASAYGWIAGYEDNTFRPQNPVTRAEAAKILYGLFAEK